MRLRLVDCLVVPLLALWVIGLPDAWAQQPRKLAPGIITVIPPAPRSSETYTGPLHLKELRTVDFSPNYAAPSSILQERVKHVIFRREIWNLEFAFKPLRTMEADVPQPNGTMKRKLIWYMVYRLRNLGGSEVPKPQVGEHGNTTYLTESVDDLDPKNMADRFFPLFVMEGWVQDPVRGVYKKLPYVDRVLPGVVPQIRAQEDPAIPLLNSIEISRVRIPLSDATTSRTVWGVVTWEDVDPRIDYASIFVRGLTNAYQFQDWPDGRRTYTFKTLQLNFWRPGDTKAEEMDRIRFGVPLVSDPLEQMQIFRMYRIPGPQISGYEVTPTTDRETPLFRLDADLDERHESRLALELNAGNFPAIVVEQLGRLGLMVPNDHPVTPFIPGSQWDFQLEIDGQMRSFRLRLEPAYWEMTQTGLKIKERVDHLWVYR